jgi:hypothetical protein
MIARLLAVSVLVFPLSAMPFNGWSFPLTGPDGPDANGRQEREGNCEREMKDYLEALKPVVVNCLEDATTVDEARKCADLLV